MSCPVLTQEEHPIEMVHADQFTLERVGESNAYYARGDVHFRQGPSELFADSAIWFEDTGEIHCFGNVRVEDTVETLHCDSLIFISKTNLAFAKGHVEYRRLHSDLVARADRGEYDRDQRIATFYQNAVMIYNESASSSRIETTADTLRFFGDDETGHAIGRVRVQRSDGEITAREAQFHSEDIRDRIEFVGNPEGTFKRHDIAGDTVILTTINDDLEALTSLGNARATFRERSGTLGRVTSSDIVSNEMFMYFQDGALSELVAIGEAESQYVPAWGRIGERNDASGDTVKISIADSTVQRVQVIGGAEGTYYTPRGDSASLDIDTIRYKSSYIDYHVEENWIRLWDRADLTYGAVNLTAGQVIYQTEASVLRAYALDDTLLPPPPDYHGKPTLSLPAAIPDSIRARLEEEAALDSTYEEDPQNPVLKEGSQEVDGRRLVYDIQTQRGRIVQSSTSAQDGFYRGDDFRLEAPKTFYVENGNYSTCELEPQHFGFTGGKMKIREKDKVYARPVVLRIEQIPVLWIPYYVFSIKDERHSGMLPLRFGNIERGSRYVRNIGYYFAVSDYWDIAPALDIVEGQGVLWHVRTSYALRYKLSGTLFGSYNTHTAVTPTGEQKTTRWNLLFSHNQQISPTVSLQGSGNFVSDNSFYQDFTADPNFRLDRRLRSQMNLNKRWTSSSFVVALDDSRNLDDNTRTSLLPRYTLTIPQRQIFAPKKLKGGRTEDPKWYHNIRAGFNSIGQNITDQIKLGSATFGTHRITADHRANINYSGKAGPFTLTPALSLQETWYYVYAPTNDTLAGGRDTLPFGVQAESFERRLAGNFSVSSQTNLYGIFNLNRGALAGFRHVFTPSVTISMAPAVVQNQAIRNYTGVGGGGSRSAIMGIGLGNLIQMKTVSGESEKRWDLLNVGINASYNFEAITRKWSNIGTSIRSGLIRNPDISVSMVHDPYDPVTGSLDWPELRSISTSIAFRFSGRGRTRPGPGYDPGGYYPTQGGADFEVPGGSLGGFQEDYGPLRSWDFQAAYQFSETRTPNPFNPSTTLKTISHWIRPNLRFTPTPNWDVQTNLYYDIRNQTMNDWTIRLKRNLHCWEGEFSWVVTGARAGYYFRINVKRISSLKFEKSESGLRDALFGALPGT